MASNSNNVLIPLTFVLGLGVGLILGGVAVYPLGSNKIMEIKESARKAGVGEYYLDENNNKNFRWITPNKISSKEQFREKIMDKENKNEDDDTSSS